MNARPAFLPDVSDAARALGRLGGRPRGSYSSPLAIWLRAEIKQRRREGYGCRESFLRDTEEPDGCDAFTVRDYTADTHSLDIGARVSWANFRKIWATETALCSPRS